MSEEALVFDCEGCELVGIFHPPVSISNNTAVLIVVGGPQYRVGSHRQFLNLARFLAANGYAVLRFDTRGMGDSSGEFPGFEHLDADILAATQVLKRKVASDCQIVLWGLCDGASAAALFAEKHREVTGLVLVNPWVRTQTSYVKTQIKHYYFQRLFSKDFWRKLLFGRFALGTFARDIVDLTRRVKDVAAKPNSHDHRHWIDRMLAGGLASQSPPMIVLSGVDLVAKEFEDLCKTSEAWGRLWERSQIHRFSRADHTFSDPEYESQLEQATLGYLNAI